MQIPAKRGLILVFREENSEDFKEIARRTYKLDPNLRILGFPVKIDPQKIPPGFFHIPHLVIYLVNPPPDDFVHESPMLAVRSMGKIEEYEHFKKHNLPCLPIEKFEWGMKLDEKVYEDWVVLKPERMTSTGKDINMIPTRQISSLKPENFPATHLIHQDGYLVQKMLKTGNYPSIDRVNVFLDEVMYSMTAQLNEPYPNEDACLDLLINTSVATNQHAKRTRVFVKNEEVNNFALEVAATFPNNPLFGIDILRDPVSKKLYVLEGNLGGNVWHFSSAVAKKTPGYDATTRKQMVLQYNAWDRAAEALVRKTHELAR